MDMGHWYVYLPLRRLGHEVYFYDTVEPEEKDYKKIIEEFKPDLIYCCLTGNKSIAPHEPWKEILDETNSGRTKTFNWFTGISNLCIIKINICNTKKITIQ